MIDARSILGSILGAGLAPSAGRRLDRAADSPQAQGTGGGLGDILAAARQAMGETGRQAQAGNPVAVGGLGALAGAILGGARGSASRGALGGAALALLGQVAYSALQGRLGGDAAGAAPASGDQEAASEGRALVLLRAMISAAKADGQIDGREMDRILAKLDEGGADQEAKDLVLAEMRRPLDVGGLAAEASTPELAAQIYAASLLAIEVDTPAERDYLDRLAAALRLDADARRRIHDALGVDAPP